MTRRLQTSLKKRVSNIEEIEMPGRSALEEDFYPFPNREDGGAERSTKGPFALQLAFHDVVELDTPHTPEILTILPLLHQILPLHWQNLTVLRLHFGMQPVLQLWPGHHSLH